VTEARDGVQAPTGGSVGPTSSCSILNLRSRRLRRAVTPPVAARDASIPVIVSPQGRRRQRVRGFELAPILPHQAVPRARLSRVSKRCSAAAARTPAAARDASGFASWTPTPCGARASSSRCWCCGARRTAAARDRWGTVHGTSRSADTGAGFAARAARGNRLRPAPFLQSEPHRAFYQHASDEIALIPVFAAFVAGCDGRVCGGARSRRVARARGGRRRFACPGSAEHW